MYPALSGIRVLECAGHVAGAYCGRLLADAGAYVIKVERPDGGDALRQEGPFPGDTPGVETSLLHQYVNANKQSVTLDAATRQGRQLLTKLCAIADIVVEERPGSCFDQASLHYSDIHNANPLTVVLTVSPFGQHGPKSAWKGYGLTVEQASGMGWLTHTGLSRRLLPDRQPLMMGGHIGEYFVAFTGAAAVMFGLFARIATGQGQHIDLSSQDALVSLERGPVSIYANQNLLETPQTRDFPYGGCFPCADGYVEILAHEDHHWAGLAEMIEKPEWSRDPEWAVRQSRVKRAADIQATIESWARTHTRQEIYECGLRCGVPVGAFCSPTEVTASEHERFRGFFEPLAHPEIPEIRSIPSLPFILAPLPTQACRRAPHLGEHNQDVYCGLLGASRGDLTSLRQTGVI